MTASLRSSMTFERENPVADCSANHKNLNCGNRPVRSRTSSVSSSQSKNEKGTQRKSTSLPSETVEYLKAWMMSPEHISHPYPTEQEKCQIMSDTGIELKQLTNWFVNNRKRYWKPRVEAQLKRKAQASQTLSAAASLVADRTLMTPYLSVVSPDSHFQTMPSKRSFKPVHTMPATSPSFVNQSRPVVSDCSSYGSDHIPSNDESNEHDMQQLPNSISFQGENAATSQHQYENRLELLNETEALTLHILRPSDPNALPTIEDVTTISNVPSECILKSYFDCIVEYNIPRKVIGDQKEIQKVRDAAIIKAKNLYLSHFLKSLRKNENRESSSKFATSVPLNKNFTSIDTRNDPIQAESFRPFKRPRTITEGSTTTKALIVPNNSPSKHTIGLPSIRYQSEDTNKWRDVCSNARNILDDSLPTLEEAARMFGYVKNSPSNFTA